MKRKKPVQKKVELNMTSMIDVVFLLLIFFVMTFKIVAPEGDFSIKMPPKSTAKDTTLTDPPEPLRVRLVSTPKGDLSAIYFGDIPLGRSFVELRRRVLREVVNRGGPDNADVEVELAPDNKLRYAYVIEAITAVTGEMKDNQIYKICDKVKFAPRRRGG